MAEKYRLYITIFRPDGTRKKKQISFSSPHDIQASEMASCRLNDVMTNEDGVGTEFGARLFKEINIDIQK